MNRYDFRRLASLRLDEARTLLQQGKYSGCYYLSGYAVECGLKACIAKLTKRYDFPSRNTNNFYTHEINLLLRTAQLERARDLEAENDDKFKYNWIVVKDWNEHSRYHSATRQQAEEMFKAIADRQHGVLRWIRRHW